MVFALGNSVSSAKANEASESAEQARAAFAARFDDYKGVLRDIERLRTEYQTVDAARRQRINEELTGQVAHAQALIHDLVDAAKELYRVAPDADPQVRELLVAVAQHHVAGRETEGPPAQSTGGDQYEKALPIIQLLVDGGADAHELTVWGFLCAFVTNDYDLAEQYLEQALESGAFEAVEGPADPARSRVHGLAANYAQRVDKYHEMWTEEAAIRAAEADADDLPRVTLTTTKGEITVELFENEAPEAVANFITLVRQAFYDGSPFHRVLPGFMAQGGAKTDDGQGGPGYTIRCESHEPEARMHFRGSLSMAHRGRDTGSSQFFLTFVPTTHLDGLHTVFGRVIEGIEVLGDLQHRDPAAGGRLPEPDRILRAEVLRDRGHEYAFERLPE